MLLVQFYALLAVTTTGILSAAAARWDFDQLRGSTPPLAQLAPRCVAIVLGTEVGEPTHEFAMPPRLQLDTSRASWGKPIPGWYQVIPETDYRVMDDRGYVHGPSMWQPAGSDSIDVVLGGWPMSLRLRIATSPAVAGGRLVAFGDVSSVMPFKGENHIVNWPPVYSVSAIHQSCARLVRHSGR
jgi:hypothetical protein